ncbi:MAG: DUF4956 domain-containing protein [Firmicutes bacterium]|nr:DUF4956 domain-containing protein [Bacillota bacterium]
MNFNEIFKSSFIDNVAAVQPFDMVLAIGMSFVLGLFIFVIYKKTFNGVLYSSGFGLSLVALSMITSMVILTISSNVVLSLGMVGALSIVRFRTAIKDPMDIVYLFWAIAAGIVCGAGLVPLALFGSLFIGVIIVLFANRKTKDNPYLLIVDCENDTAENKAVDVVAKAGKKYVLKTKTISAKGIEMTLEIRLPDMNSQFMNQINSVPGVRSAMLVGYNGEYLS